MSDSSIAVPKDTQVPNHIAIILDGNRRWARARGLSTIDGHRAGFDASRRVARAARALGVHTFTVWGFSTENWNRSPKEIAYLMGLFRKFFIETRKEAQKEGVRVIHLGRKDRLPKTLMRLIKSVEDETANNTKFILNVALDYGGRDEIIRAIKKLVADEVPVSDINEDMFANYLDTQGQPYPYPDLFIRPSGEQRTSGLLPWQMVYAEYYWEESHLPDLTPEKLRDAVLDYSRRRRRFGGNDKEEHLTFKPQLTAQLEVNWWRLSNIPKGTRFRDYAVSHLKEQWGLSKHLAKQAAVLMAEALVEGENKKWHDARKKLGKFYKIVRDEVKLAFEPSLAASLQAKLWQKGSLSGNFSFQEIEDTSRQFVSEVYRISDLQASKAAHLMALATYERSLAQKGNGEMHWKKAEDYLQKYYEALKDRVA